MTIGVVVATYNGASFIEEQLKSIVNQTLPPTLIIVSDARSKDNTVEICKKVLGSQETIKYRIVQNETQLLPAQNFETGLALCNTDYVFFADQDDVWEINKIADLVDAMENENADLAFCNAQIVDSCLCPKEGTLWDAIGFNPKETYTVFDRTDSDFLKKIIKNNIVTGMCLGLKARVKNYIMPFSRHCLHDWWIAMVANCSFKMVAVNHIGVKYRQHGGNQVGVTRDIQSKRKSLQIAKDSIAERIMAVEDIIDRYARFGCDTLYLHRYCYYLERRLSFISKERGCRPVGIKDYCKFEKSPVKTIIKDILVRLVK